MGVQVRVLYGRPMHEDKKVFEMEVEKLGTLKLFVDKEQGTAWFQVEGDPINIGWAYVRKCTGKLTYGSVNAAPSF